MISYLFMTTLASRLADRDSTFPEWQRVDYDTITVRWTHTHSRIWLIGFPFQELDEPECHLMMEFQVTPDNLVIENVERLMTEDAVERFCHWVSRVYRYLSAEPIPRFPTMAFRRWR